MEPPLESPADGVTQRDGYSWTTRNVRTARSVASRRRALRSSKLDPNSPAIRRLLDGEAASFGMSQRSRLPPIQWSVY